MRLPGAGGRGESTALSTATRALASASPPLAPMAQLTLEDVARDAFRRKFFLDAFANERESLERSISFLQRVRDYKKLVGRRDVLQNVAETTVEEYLRDQPAHLCVFLRSPSTSELLQRIFEAVDSKRSTLDLFCGMEAHVTDRLEKEKFVAFLQTPQYTQLCDAIRKHRDLPLGEILVDARSTRFLEQFVRQMNAPLAVGNLLFWVEVQTIFLPLLQTTVVSVTLFEEIQATVRRLYNTFLTESSTVAATVVPDTLRKDILKRILQLQGEPFSPSRYATLFRQAQEKIWHWMQTYVYPKFHASMLYVALVVETENLESDRQLRKLSEHVQAAYAPPASAVSIAAAKASAIFVPVEPSGTQSKPYGDARYLRVVAPLHSEDKPSKWTTTMVLPPTLSHDLGVRAIRVVDVVQADNDGQVVYKHQLRAVLDEHDVDVSEGDRLDVMDFVWNWRHVISLPTVLSPSHRPHGTVPKSSFHSFSLPTTSRVLYGHVVTSWSHVVASLEVNPRPPEETAEEEDTADSASSMLVPRFAFLLASQRISQPRVASGLGRLAEMPLDTFQPHDLTDLFVASGELSNGHKDTNSRRRLTGTFSGFYLQPQLAEASFHVHWIFRELSHQTVVSLLASLLVGKSLVLVSPRPSALMLVANALVELLRPLALTHFVLPLCPVRTACALADRGFFASPMSSFGRSDQPQAPFLIGLEGDLVHLKSKDSTNEPRHRIRNSIYSVQRVNVQIRRPLPPHAHAVSCQHVDTAQYPTEVLHTQAIVLDVDADDVYVPDRLDVPEFPQPLVRSLETMLKDARLGGGLATEDSRLFTPPPSVPSFVEGMLEEEEEEEELSGPSARMVATVDSVRLAVLLFLESLLGDVVLYFCSFRKSFAPPAAAAADTVVADSPDTYILFEADAFLDAKMELGCREFFRQLFQTEMFRQFLVRQHQRFALHD